MKNLYTRLANLLAIKSIVTLIATAVFAYKEITGTMSNDFMTIYTMIISFYFCTQKLKGEDASGKN